MTTRSTLALVVLLAHAACWRTERDGLYPGADAGESLRHDCALAEHRCARCHSIDRVRRARVDSPSHWGVYVHRMRLQPQSGILPAEEAPIRRCLVYRSFGERGLATLPAEERP